MSGSAHAQGDMLNMHKTCRGPCTNLQESDHRAVDDHGTIQHDYSFIPHLQELIEVVAYVMVPQSRIQNLEVSIVHVLKD